MKFRLQSELRKGTPRWYLVRSEYIKGTGKRRPVRVRYLGYPPSDRMRNLIAKLNEIVRHRKQFSTDDAIFKQIETEKLKTRNLHKAQRKSLRARKPKSIKRNLFSDFVSQSARLDVLIAELFKSDPPEKWPAEKLDAFMEATDWINVKMKSAKKLLNF